MRERWMNAVTVADGDDLDAIVALDRLARAALAQILVIDILGSRFMRGPSLALDDRLAAELDDDAVADLLST